MKLHLLLTLLTSAAFAGQTNITIEAGDFDRSYTVVECVLPPGMEPGILAHSVTGIGQDTALQVGPEGRGWFIERNLKRGERKTYVFKSGPARVPVRALAANGAITLSAFGRTAFVYRTEKTEFPPNRPDLTEIFHRGGYIHPVLSPGGKQITDDYPANHKHHHGIWWAWTHTEFEGRKPDFWNMGEGKGTVEFTGIDKVWSGPVHAGFISQLRQMDLTERSESGTPLKPKTALFETWNVKLYGVGNDADRPYFVFDVEITDTCAHGPLKLPKYRYGGLGLRGNGAWNGKTNLNFITSNGDTDRSKGDNNETRGHWAHLGGRVAGGLTGIAVLSHPANIHSPQPMRIHPDEPFFSFSPQQAGDMEITPGQPLVARYRFVVADGAPDKEALDRLWNDYAHPPRVTVIVEK